MDDETGTERGIELPRHVRFARSLALLSGVAGIGFAAGVTVLTAAGCGQSCNGICGVYGVSGVTAMDSGHHDEDGGGADALDGEALDGPVNSGTGGAGGPLPAPPLPRAWLV